MLSLKFLSNLAVTACYGHQDHKEVKNYEQLRIVVYS